ncbi:Condensin complex subunit [Operophtera brumata]|uniref:Condensin complex subunit n=1 Tax=Operophtera brumata TaxID=104452 RepID=A0A0L7LPA2_OPEBR|nr:Condensin complex subunit [Operophtera brumata]
MPVVDTEVTRVATSTAPKPNPRNNPVMFKIFQNVQYNVVQHKKYVKEMIKLYKKLLAAVLAALGEDASLDDGLCDKLLASQVGLTERSLRVRRVVEEILVPGWLSSFQGNIVDLLKAIRLDNVNDAKDSQRLPISELLEWLPTEKSLRLIPAEKLNKETSWYWRHLAEHLQKIEDDETLETILPDLIKPMVILFPYRVVESPCPSETGDPVAFSTRQYVLHELGSLLRVYDATDPASRTDLHQLITDVLTGDYGPLSSDVIRAFVSALELVVPELIDMSNEPIVKVVLRCLVDLLCVHGARVFEDDVAESQQNNTTKNTTRNSTTLDDDGM